jgi:Orsellinic acid/F9775 biosynthesis cluster protein D
MCSQEHIHLLRHPLLSSLGLVVDPGLKSLCCESCQISLIPGAVVSHLRKLHKCSYMLIDSKMLLEVCDELGALTEYPSMIEKEPHTEYAGLKLHKGLGCHYCSFVCISLEHMAKHHRKKHGAMGSVTSWPTVDIQQLDRQVHKTFFRVTPLKLPTVIPDDTYIQNLTKLMEESQDEYVAGGLNARQISPWLLTTRWHEHVEGYDVAELRTLTAVPIRTEFPGLHKGLEHLFALCLEAMDQLPELVLQRLNTPDPAKTYVVFLLCAII